MAQGETMTPELRALLVDVRDILMILNLHGTFYQSIEGRLKAALAQPTATQQAQDGISEGVGLPNPSPVDVAAYTQEPSTDDLVDRLDFIANNTQTVISEEIEEVCSASSGRLANLQSERDAALREIAELLIRFNRNVERSDKDLAEIAELRGRLNIGGWSYLHTLQRRAETAEASLAALKAAMAEAGKGLPDWPDPMDRWERSVDSWIRADVYNKLRHAATGNIAAQTKKLPCGHWARDHKNPDGTCAHCAMLLSYERQGEEIEKVSAQLAEAQKDAERYRWIRSNSNSSFELIADTPYAGSEDEDHLHHTWKGPMIDNFLDKCIDAAIAAARSTT